MDIANKISLYDGSIFSERFITLRKLYGIRQKDLAILLKYKSRGNIADLESGRVRPSFEVLMRIHHFYGISIDWLMGIGDIPYSDESITKAEEYANLNEALNFPHEIKKYVNHVYNDKDPSYYTIDNRFNLLFLRNFVVGNIVHGNEWDNPTIVERINSFLSLLKIPSEAEFQENWKFAVKLDENNKKIWKNPQVPIYNLSAYLSTHSK